MINRVKKISIRICMYFVAHLRACLFSLGRLLRAPIATFMTTSVIGIALALPLSFYVLLHNAQNLVSRWNDSSTQITLYLKKDLPEMRINDLLQQLKTNPEISNVNYISPQEGLKQFQQSLNSAQAINALKVNPLPGVIIVQPILSLRSPLIISQLLNTLQQLSEIDMAQLDMLWLQRLNNIINLAAHGVLALAFLLGLGVLLIISNTIRLATQNDRREIFVLKLVGATNAFINRPFLYTGIWYGFFAGLISLFLVAILIWSLQQPVAKLAASYNSNIYLQGLKFHLSILVLIASMILGLIGARFSVIFTRRNMS